MRRVRTRYAPSPTGFQHIGGVRTALYCYLFAKKNQGDFLLRIEDTDQSRYVEGAEEYILQTLNWCGIMPDEGVFSGGPHAPYRQSERKAIYKQYAERLLANGSAYYAFDSAEELEAQRTLYPNFQYNAATRPLMKNQYTVSETDANHYIENGQYVVRFKMPADETVLVNDLIRGEVSVSTNDLDDKVLMKSDGMPTYHLANVTDDYLMQISHVIRGEEWLPSTPLHVLLYRALGWEEVMPAFAHVPLMLNPDGKGKLSKRNGDRYGFPVFPLAWHNDQTGEKATGFKEMGFLPEAFINMLAFFGWHPDSEQEVFSITELIEAFSLERVSKSGAKFDFEKAKWFNQQHLRHTPKDVLAKGIGSFAPDNFKHINSDYLAEACALMKDRLTFLPDLWLQAPYLFERPTEYDLSVVQKKWSEARVAFFTTFIDALQQLADFTPAQFEGLTKEQIKVAGLGMGDIMPLFRIMLTGTMQGPPVPDTAVLLGKTETIARIEHAMQVFAAYN